MAFQCCGIASDGGARVGACLCVISLTDKGLTLETFHLYQLFIYQTPLFLISSTTRAKSWLHLRTHFPNWNRSGAQSPPPPPPPEGTLGISGWGCVARMPGTLEPLAYTRVSSAEFWYPMLGLTPHPPPPYPRVAVPAETTEVTSTVLVKNDTLF